MKKIFLALVLALPAGAQEPPSAPVPAQPPDPVVNQPDVAPNPGPLPATPPTVRADSVNSLTLPSAPVADVLSLYESLTGKRLIRDANLAGPNLTIMVPGSIPRADAIAIIESTLILNGYSLVPGDDGSVRVLGPQRPPLGEGIPLFADPRSLPPGDQIVSYYMPLRYIAAKDALTTFQAYVTKRATGSMIAIPNVNAIVVTDNTPLIRRLIDLKHFIDIPGARTLTKFMALQRADAEKVAEVLSKLLEQQKSSAQQAGGGGVIAAPAQGTEVGEVPPPPGGPPGAISTPVFAAQILADNRTNRVLVVASESEMPELERLVREMDEAVDYAKPLEYHLNFAKAEEVLPVLESVLAEGDDKAETTGEAGGTGGSNAASGASSGNNNNSSQGGSSFGGLGGGATKSDLLDSPEVNTAPQASRIGKNVRVIADPAANTIIVFGPPEAKARTATVLKSLDRRPKLIYLAAVIGQLTLGDNLEVGVDYLLHFKNMDPGGPATGVGGLVRTTGGVDILSDPSKILSNAAQSLAGTGATAAAAATPLASGLTLYGTIAETVDIYARALATTDRFKVVSRPVVYTTNNNKAVISSGQSVPVASNTLSQPVSGTLNGGLSTALSATIQYIPVVLKLEIIPQVNSDDEVTLTIAQQNDNVLGSVQVADNTAPIIGTQSLTTTVTIKNRQTVVLGGLITEEETNSKSGIPLISSVPGLGYLFSTNKKSKTRRELIIMIQPLIVNSEADVAEANYIERSMSSLQGEFYDNGIPVRRAERVLPGDPILKGRKPVFPTIPKPTSVPLNAYPEN